MSEYPSDWKVLPLGEVAEVVGGGTPSRDTPAFWGEDHFWITPSEVVARDGQTTGRSKEKISDFGLQNSGAKLHPPGTILMTSRASVGFATIATEEICTNQGFQSLRCGEELDNWFALHQIRHRRAELQQLGAGSTFLEVSGSNVRSFPFVVPPLPEQKKIAEILSGIDRLVAFQSNKIQSSQLLKKALVSRHVENIDRAIDEAKLDNLIHSIDSGWSPDCLKRPPISESEWSILKTTSVTWKGFDQEERKALPSNLLPREELVVEEGDVLITRAGPADRTGVVAYADKKAINTMISDKIIRLKCDSSVIDPRFLSIFLGTDYAQRQMLKGKVGMASSQTNISQQLLREMIIRFPSLSEQKRISEIVAELQKVINQIQSCVEHIENLKRSLSSDLLSGRKRVNV